jgi:curved DNA-binding protein CbpA
MFMIDLGVQSYYSLLGVSPSANAAEIREARDRKIKELRERQRIAKGPEAENIKARQKEINAAGETLARPKDREKYDRLNSHLKFFSVRVAAAPLFVEKADRMYVLHRAMREFLAAKGVNLQPLSDIEREDFSADETPIDLLDDLIG